MKLAYLPLILMMPGYSGMKWSPWVPLGRGFFEAGINFEFEGSPKTPL
jgi:hypothetical protein